MTEARVRPTMLVGSELDVTQTSTAGEIYTARESFDYPDTVGRVPVTWIEKYAHLALRYAVVEEVDPGVWYAEVPMLPGAGIDGDTSEEALAELEASVAGWVAVRLRAGLRVPVLEGLDLNLHDE